MARISVGAAFAQVALGAPTPRRPSSCGTPGTYGFLDRAAEGSARIRSTFSAATP